MRFCALLPCLLLLSALTPSCDSQVAPEFRGEALLTLRGSVEIDDPPEDAELVPAVAFFNGETGMVHIVDVEVEGEFPSDFVLRVMQPPPAEALFEGPDGIESALGYITAVTADRPDSFAYVTSSGGAAACYSNESGGGCDSWRWWCSGAGEAMSCYSERMHCPQNDGPAPGCEVVDSAGDSSLKETWSKFAGLSEDLVLVHLSEALDADAADAERLGLPGLPAGYSVLEPQPGYDPDSPESSDCDMAIERRAVELHAEANDTGVSYDYLIAQGGCGGEDQEAWVPCDPRTDRIWREISEEFRDQAIAELGCRAVGHWQVLEDAESTRIALRIGSDVRPSVFAPDGYSHTPTFAQAVAFGGAEPPEPDPYFSSLCGAPEEQPLAWDEVGPTGQTPEELFAGLESECITEVQWDAAEYVPFEGQPQVRVEPASGSSEIEVAVMLDRGSARALSFPDGMGDRCDPTVLIDGEVQARSADGVIDGGGRFTANEYAVAHAKQPYEEHGGSLEVDAELLPGERVFLEYHVGASHLSCIGNISVFVQTELDPFDGAPAGHMHSVGNWSSNGCEPFGAERQDASSPIEGLDRSPQELVQSWFGAVTLPGQWEDGGQAELTLSATLAETTVCVGPDYLDAAVTLSYGMSDGSIAERTVEGSLSISYRDPARPEGRLLLIDDVTCASTSSALPHASASCEEQAALTVRAQLLHDGNAIDTSDGLRVYEYDRGGVWDLYGKEGRQQDWLDYEAADRRRIFTPTP